MPIDASIYQNLRPAQMPDIMGSAQKAATLRQMAMQQNQMRRQTELQDREIAEQEALKGAYAKSVGPDGKMNQGVFLAHLGGINPMKAAEFESKFGDADLERQLKKAQLGKIAAENDPTDRALRRRREEAEINRLYAEGKKAGLEGATKLRHERSGLPTTRATQEVSTAFNRIQGAAKDPSPAGDLSLIFGYMKMLDPGSTVREGEFANAQNAGSAFDRAGSLYNAVLRGQRLTEKQRADFMTKAHGLYSAQLSQQKKIDEDYRRLAQKGGIAPEDVLLNFEADAYQPPRQLGGITREDAQAELQRRRQARFAAQGGGS